MTDVPFSYSWADLIGNLTGQLIYTAPSWNLKGISIIFSGQPGYASSDTNLYITLKTGAINNQRFIANPQIDPNGAPLANVSATIINLSGLSIDITNDLRLFYPANGDYTPDIDPQNITVSGNITI